METGPPQYRDIPRSFQLLIQQSLVALIGLLGDLLPQLPLRLAQDGHHRLFAELSLPHFIPPIFPEASSFSIFRWSEIARAGHCLSALCSGLDDGSQGGGEGCSSLAWVKFDSILFGNVEEALILRGDVTGEEIDETARKKDGFTGAPCCGAHLLCDLALH